MLCEKSKVKYLELQLLSANSCCTTPQTFQSIVSYRGCSIITSRIGGGWVSAFFVMLRDGKLGGEWCFMKDCHVTVKKMKKSFLYYCEEIGISLIQNINGKFTYINGHSIFVIILYLRSFLYKVVH